MWTVYIGILMTTKSLKSRLIESKLYSVDSSDHMVSLLILTWQYNGSLCFDHRRTCYCHMTVAKPWTLIIASIRWWVYNTTARMLQLKNRLKYCSVAIAANRLVSGPMKNPIVFMDIAADGESIGRIIIEASHDLLKLNST